MALYGNLFYTLLTYIILSQVALVVKNPPAIAGAAVDCGSIPGSGRYPGEGNGYPHQYSYLKNTMGQGA